MARKNKLLVPEARAGLNQLKERVMKAKGYNATADNVKFEVAKEQGIPLSKGKNGQLTSEQAGKIGGPIGGNMVKEMIKMAQEQLMRK
ncbi:alpha/beta-type small acid-soluble spore protein [Bacillus sp. FSL K6-3431]|uniref:alpha/beta-type small acid-soluble spore protein n=1 Tax=Bacillus sp. FSL K6-3431 TaxID=2921500 RepID=UPI0030FC33D3